MHPITLRRSSSEAAVVQILRIYPVPLLLSAVLPFRRFIAEKLGDACVDVDLTNSQMRYAATFIMVQELHPSRILRNNIASDAEYETKDETDGRP